MVASEAARSQATSPSPGDAPERPRPYHHGDLPAALLDAVGSLIEEQGLDAVTLRAAARRAGVSHAAPAHHFGDKGGLLAAFAEQGFQAFTKDLEEARASTPGTPAERMEAMGRAYLAFAKQHRPWFEVMFRPELIGAHRSEVSETGQRSFAVLVMQVSECLTPQTDPQEITGLAMAAWATVHGLAHLLTAGPAHDLEVAETEGMTDTVLATLLAGMRAHPGWIGDTPLGDPRGA